MGCQDMLLSLLCFACLLFESACMKLFVFDQILCHILAFKLKDTCRCFVLFTGCFMLEFGEGLGELNSAWELCNN